VNVGSCASNFVRFNPLGHAVKNKEISILQYFGSGVQTNGWIYAMVLLGMFVRCLTGGWPLQFFRSYHLSFRDKEHVIVTLNGSTQRN
jgi:hypothetical protein